MGEDEEIEDDARIRNDLWIWDYYVGLVQEFPRRRR
jgi:hypothetical protein